MNSKSKGESRKAKVLNACLAACLLAAVILAFPAGAQQESLGRLFFTPAQRSSLDVARSQRARATLSTETTEEQAAPAAQTITYGGVVRRSDGKSTVWINGRPMSGEEAMGGGTVVGRVRTDGSVSVQVPQSGRSVNLKPGQSVELLSGTVEEGYTRKPVASAALSAKPDAKPAAAEKKGKPSAEEIAKADREREDREQQRLEDALRAIQDAGTLKPAPRPTPSAEGLAR